MSITDASKPKKQVYQNVRLQYIYILERLPTVTNDYGHCLVVFQHSCKVNMDTQENVIGSLWEDLLNMRLL